MKLQEAELTSINFLFKGEPSSGKSLAAASFPNCYIFDFESRIRSVANYWLPKGKKDISFDTYGRKDFNKFIDKVNMLQSHCPYDTVIFDTLTSLVDLILFHTAELRGTGKGSNVIAGVKMNTIEDYGVEDTVLRNLMAHIRDMKVKHKILVAHVVRTEEKKLGAASVITRSLLTAGKKSAAKVPAYFDEIYHFQQQPNQNMKPEFVALTMNTGDDFARTTMSLPRAINFTDSSFYDIIKPNLEMPYVAPNEAPNVDAGEEK